MAINTQIAAQLKSFAAAGDVVAKALVENVKDVRLTAGTEAANVIKVTGQILDGAGNVVQGVKNVLVRSYPVSGAGTLTDGGAGLIKVGSASTTAWFQTDSTGKFEANVTNVVAEDNLVEAVTADGDVAMLVLTFA